MKFACEELFADVLADLIEHEGITSGFWVSLYNEPNSGGLTLPQFEATYRQLDAELRARGVRDRIRFLGGGILASTNQGTWYWYMAQRMGDLLDAWAPHVYWDFWDTPKIERRLTEVRAIVDAIPENLRKPIYVTEFGVRGLRTFDGELTFEPGYFPDGTPVAALPRTMQVDASDGFQTRRYDLDRITRLCQPVAKSGSPVVLKGPGVGTPVPLAPADVRYPFDHLLCFQAKLATRLVAQTGCLPTDPADKGVKIDPKQANSTERGLYVTSQLGPTQVDTKKVVEICLPATSPDPGITDP